MAVAGPCSIQASWLHIGPIIKAVVSGIKLNSVLSLQPHWNVNVQRPADVLSAGLHPPLLQSNGARRGTRDGRGTIKSVKLCSTVDWR